MESMKSEVVGFAAEGELNLFYGNEVNRVLENESFCKEWDELYRTCAWCTIFQERDFFILYHQIYRKSHLPLLVVLQEKGKLLGLLALTVNQKDLKITGAGGKDAHYHAWIAKPDISGAFISKALKAVQDQFATSEISLYQLPPQIELEWLKADKDWEGKYTLEAEKRPVVNLKDPSVFSLIKKKDFKLNTNRLKRAGAYEVEKVTDLDEFLVALDVITGLTDFRQGAINGWFPFKNNPTRKGLYKEMFKAGYLYMVVLKLNGEIIAGLTGTIGKDGWLHGAGVNCHSPLYHHYSPGFLSFINLAMLLESDGYHWLDLSTGLLSYKKRMANHYDEVYALDIAPKSPSLDEMPLVEKLTGFKKSLSSSVWKLIERNGRMPYDRDFIREKVKIFAKNKDYLPLVDFLRTGNCQESKQIFKYNWKTYTTNSGVVDYKINCIPHLLKYQPLGLNLTISEFYRCAGERFTDKQICFSHVEKNILRWCVWEKTIEKKDDLSIVLLEVFYCSPSYLQALEQIIVTLAGNYDRQKIGEVYIALGDREKPYLAEILDKQKMVDLSKEAVSD